MTAPSPATTVGSSLVAVALGIGVGLVTTFAHRAYEVEIGVPVPLGLVAGLGIVAALLIGLRLVFESRIVAVAGAVGLLGAILVLAAPGSGGSAVVLGDAVGSVWALTPVVIATIVVALPLRRTAAD